MTGPRANRRRWVISWLLALALHALAITGLQAGRKWVPEPPQETQPEPIKLTFLQAPPAKSEPKAPTYFVELPADREDLTPEHAEFLSNVTSRARDLVPGGDQSLPRSSGETDMPSVAMQSGHVDPTPASAPTTQAGQQPLGAEAKETVETPGTSDIRQSEMDNPTGNAEPNGVVSLSTTEWEYAPWLQRFGRRLMQRWTAPPAYYMGLLREGGWTVVEMEIARSGQVRRMDVLEQQGHPALISAATGALRSMAPLEALPADFPDSTLILRVRLLYPKYRPR